MLVLYKINTPVYDVMGVIAFDLFYLLIVVILTLITFKCNQYLAGGKKIGILSKIIITTAGGIAFLGAVIITLGVIELTLFFIGVMSGGWKP